MNRLKNLGLALIAILAMSALGATGATGHSFQSSAEKTALTGERIGLSHVWGTKSSNLEVKCLKTSLTGTMAQAVVGELTLHPIFNECTTSPLGASPVDTAGCNYVLSGQTTKRVSTVGEETDAPVSIECSEGEAIKITASGCTITIGAQTGLHGVSYFPELEAGGGLRINLGVDWTVDKIKYTTPGGFICSLAGLKASGEDMFYTGTTTVKGYVDGSVHQIGNQVDIGTL